MRSTSLLKQLATEKLRAIAPEMYEECEQLIVAPLTDIDLLPAVLNELTHRFEPTPENAPFIMGCVYFMFAPYKLYYSQVRMPNGIRQHLCNAFKWKDAPTCNFYGNILTAYYKNPRWKANVKLNAEEILKIINDNKAEILATYKDENDG